MARHAGRLTLIVGLPGAGKTTLAKAIEAQTGAVRLCPDEEMEARGFDLFDPEAREVVEAEQWLRAQELAEAGLGVVMENGFWAQAEREDKRRWAREHEVGVELRFVDADDGELARRVEARSRGGGWEHTRITREQLAAWRSQLEVPDAAEMALYDLPEPAAISLL